ncbi:hypothetical protein NHX12_004329, partial [Muraenolepis orangiensis]
MLRNESSGGIIIKALRRRRGSAVTLLRLWTGGGPQAPTGGIRPPLVWAVRCLRQAAIDVGFPPPLLPLSSRFLAPLTAARWHLPTK